MNRLLNYKGIQVAIYVPIPIYLITNGWNGWIK